MEDQTPNKKKKSNLFLCLFLTALFCIAVLTVFGYVESQKTIVGYVNEAIKINDLELAKTWADQVDSLERTDRHSETILMVACEYGNSDIIEWALANDADPNYAPTGAMKPLELYCSYGYKAGTDTLERLLRSGARPQYYTMTPPVFCLAERMIYMNAEEKEIAKASMVILYDNGDKIKYNNSTLFHYAAQFNIDELAQRLLQTSAGAKLLGIADGNGKTPYDLAIANGSSAVQRLIRNFEQNIRNEIEVQPTETSVPEETEDNLDELINSLMGMSPTEAPTEPIIPEVTDESDITTENTEEIPVE